MCVSFEPAALSNTVLYIGEAQHPEQGLIHVLGYQNYVSNLVDHPNCMILHFPCSSPMTPENAIDCSRTPRILQNMREALDLELMYYCLDATGAGAAAETVHVFEVGSYSVAMSAVPENIPAALNRIPESKRPMLNQKIFEWYQQNLPGYSVALCCFEGKANAAAEPMLWWYRPKDPGTLAAPALDAHDGAAPDSSIDVDVDHFLIVSVPEWSLNCDHLLEASQAALRPEIARVHYMDDISETLQPFLPKLVAGGSFRGPMINGDFVIDREGLTPQTLLQKVRRAAPGVVARI